VTDRSEGMLQESVVANFKVNPQHMLRRNKKPYGNIIQDSQTPVNNIPPKSKQISIVACYGYYRIESYSFIDLLKFLFSLD
jgi:hypothetical protein